MSMVPRRAGRVGFPFRTAYYPTDAMVAGAAYGIEKARRYFSGRSTANTAAVSALPRGRRSYVKNYQKRYRKQYQKAAARKMTRVNPALKQLDKKVRNLVKSNSIDKGELIYRYLGADRVLASQAQCGNYEFTQPISLLETVMDQLRWFNPATNAFVTADASGAQYHKVHFAMAHYSIQVRNNYQVPCKVTVYTCVPKDDTNISVATSHSDWATDNLLAGAITDPSVYITDSDEFGNLYKIQKTTKKFLNPGEELMASYSAKPFDYDSGYVDAHASTYQPGYGSMSFYVRVEGAVGHDTTVDEQAQVPCGVDMILKRTYKVVYDAGVKCKFVYSSVVQDAAFTNSGVVSQPVADNQGYSVS